MPEYGECHAHLVTGRHFLKTLGKNTKVLRLLGDSASKDTAPRPDHLHVFEFTKESDFVRGPKSAQTRVVPDETLQSPGNPNPPHISELDYVWEDVHGNGRALFLTFSGGRVFEFHWLTHSSIQLYTRKVWQESIMRVDRENRGFRIAIAFEFKDYFLSFNSIDLVVKPVWRVLSAEDLALPVVERLKLGVDVYRDYAGFLEAVAKWILHRRRGSSKRMGTARLCEAFWTYAHNAQGVWKNLLKSAYHAAISLIAPTDNQRLKYADRLFVYGKGQASIPPRMADLLSMYIDRIDALEGLGTIAYRDELNDLYDVFEPSYLCDALALSVPSKSVTTGHLIFNLPFWNSCGFGNGTMGQDALTRMFVSQGLWSAEWGAKTFLHLESYEGGLELDMVLFPKNTWPRPAVSAFKARKQIWSPLPLLPESLPAIRPPPPSKKPKKKPKKVPRKANKGKKKQTQEEAQGEEDVEGGDDEGEEERKKRRVTQLSKEKQESMEFKNIILDSNRVAIGPLEYCGHGKVVKTSQKKGKRTKYIPLAVYGDPRVGSYRSLLSLWPIFSGKGKGKRKMTNALRRQLDERHARVRIPGYDTDVDEDSDWDSDHGDDRDGDDDNNESEEGEEEEDEGGHREEDAGSSSLPPLPTTPIRRQHTLPRSSPTIIPSSPILLHPSSPTIAAPSSPPKRKRDLEKENEHIAPSYPPKKQRKVGSGLGPRKSADKHILTKAKSIVFTPSPKGGPRRSKRSK
ncbi:hypothetical protein NMY22_g5976 [Coprinellus aureogranulatus]|nr:hypothetical protein NMY22_g5976 [Coprinellus aureogranulatus]